MTHTKSNLTSSDISKVKLNLGCGLELMDDYINIDNQCINAPVGKQFIRRSFADLSFLENKSVDEIYGKQIIEHIHPMCLKEVLYEWCRVLKPDGKLILIFPDFDKCIDVYSKCKTLNYTNDYLDFIRINFCLLNSTQNETLVKADRHRSLITIPYLDRMLKSEGLEIESSEDWGSDDEKKYFTKVTIRRIRKD